MLAQGSSRFRGVSLNKGSGKWEARIREGGRNHYLGSFDDEREAAQVPLDPNIFLEQSFKGISVDSCKANHNFKMSQAGPNDLETRVFSLPKK